mmetsp:Transcript_8605/g.21966  ORF Transcript_8605/g.21966 Transcript_8605/m.21966 type:complete len:404 (-) Transcript_8605:149-1360(-)
MLAVVVDADGEDEQRVDLPLLVEEFDRIRQIVHRQNNVLHHLLCDGRLADAGRQHEFEHGRLGRAEPAEQVAVPHVVAEGDEILKHPEDGARVAVVVVPQRDELLEPRLARLCVGALKSVLEPVVVVRLEPEVDAVHFKEELVPRDVARGAELDDRPVFGVDGALEELRHLPLRQQRELLEPLAVLGVREGGDIHRLNVRLDVHHLHLHRHQQPERAAAPGQAGEQLGVLVVARGVHALARGQHDIVRDDALLHQPVSVRVCLHPEAHRNATQRDVLHLDLHLHREAARHERAREVPHVHQRLGRDSHLFFVNPEDVAHVRDRDLPALLLEVADRGRHGEPRAAVGAHLAHLLARIGACPPLANLRLDARDARVVQVRRGRKVLVEPIAQRPDCVHGKGDRQH